MITEASQRDVVFTPFMLRVRDAVSGSVPPDEMTQMKVEVSENISIAVAVDEWVGLRTYAEHIISEANAMLDPGSERIELFDEYGGVLAFQILWNGRGYRLFIDLSPDGHQGRIGAGIGSRTVAEKPTDQQALDDLIISMLNRAGTGK